MHKCRDLTLRSREVTLWHVIVCRSSFRTRSRLTHVVRQLVTLTVTATFGMTASLLLYRLCYLQPADTSTRHNLLSCWIGPRTHWYKIKSSWVILSWIVGFKRMRIFHHVFKSLKNNVSRNSGQMLMNTDVTLHEDSCWTFWEAQGHFLFIHRDICCQASDYGPDPAL